MREEEVVAVIENAMRIMKDYSRRPPKSEGQDWDNYKAEIMSLAMSCVALSSVLISVCDPDPQWTQDAVSTVTKAIGVHVKATRAMS